MVGVALMAAIVVVLANTPLGMIQLPIIKATTVHIPVIIGAILLGPMAGGILGGVFGVCSLMNNTMAPSLLSFAFSPFVYANSPFVSEPTFLGGLGTVWISVGCRILIGVAAGWLWILLKRLKDNKFIVEILTIIVAMGISGIHWSLCATIGLHWIISAVTAIAAGVAFWIIFRRRKMNQVVTLAITGFLGSMVNTVAVMGSIYLVFAEQYAKAQEVAVTAVWGLVMGTVTASGIPEAISAAVIVAFVSKVLLKLRVVNT